MANEIGQTLGIESHAFNPGVSPLTLRQRLTGLKNNTAKPDSHGDPASKHKVYITAGDWISNSGALGVSGKEHVVIGKKREGTANEHDIHNYFNISTE